MLIAGMIWYLFNREVLFKDVKISFSLPVKTVVRVSLGNESLTRSMIILIPFLEAVVINSSTSSKVPKVGQTDVKFEIS